MGKWTVLSVTGRHSALNSTSQYGTNWYVTYRLKYEKSTFGGFVELPKLAWDETIYFNDYVKNEHWWFSGNFYTRKPDSLTLEVWAQRYFRAYLQAHNKPYTYYGKEKGYSKLFDLKDKLVSAKALGTHEGHDKQNKAVQDYLKKNGGILEIQIHDIPNILKPGVGKAKNVERVLVFNVGVVGLGPRVRAWQYVKMDSSEPERNWKYQFQLGGASPGVRVSRLKVVPNPTPKSDLLPTGGIW